MPTTRIAKTLNVRASAFHFFIALLLTLVAPPLTAQVPAGFIPVSGTRVLGASGVLEPQGTLCAHINLGGAQFSAKASSGGQITQPPVCTPIVNGAFTINLPDTFLTAPQNISFDLAATDDLSGETLFDDPLVQPTSAPGSSWCANASGTTTCNFDLYQSSLPGLPLQIVSFTFRGTFAPNVIYNKNDVVLNSDGSLYICLRDGNVGYGPGNNDGSGLQWALFVPAGQRGVSAWNIRGAFAATNSYAVGDVVTYNGSTYVNSVATAPTQGTTTTTASLNLLNPQAAVPGAYISADGTNPAISGYTAFVNLPINGGAQGFVSSGRLGFYPNGPNGGGGVRVRNAAGAVIGVDVTNASSSPAGNDATAGIYHAFPPVTAGQVPASFDVYFNDAEQPAAYNQLMIVLGNTLPSSFVAYGAQQVTYTTSTGGPSSGAAVPTDASHWTLFVTPGQSASQVNAAISSALSSYTPATTGLNFRGAFSSASSYAVNDTVTYSGTSYVDVVATAPASSSTAANAAAGTNVFNPAATQPTESYINSAGAITSYSGFSSTPMMYVRGATQFTTNFPFFAGSVAYIGFYDASGTFLQATQTGGDVAASTVTAIPAGAVQMAFSYRDSAVGPSGSIPYSQAMVIIGSTLPSSYVAYSPPQSSGAGSALPTDTSHWTALASGGVSSSQVSASISSALTSYTPNQLAGKKYMVFGDSYSIQFGTVWQNLVSAETGMVLGLNRSQAGRHLYEIFSEYVTNGVLNTAALKSDLAAHDVIVVYLATNDIINMFRVGTAAAPLGSPSDTPIVPLNVQSANAAPPGSAYAYAQGAIDEIQQLAPTKPILVVGALHFDRNASYPAPAQDFTATNPTTDSFNGMLTAVTSSRALIFVNEATTSGISKSNAENPDGTPLMLRDGLHPSDTLGFPAVAHQIANGLRLLIHP